MQINEMSKRDVDGYVKKHGLFPVDSSLSIINIASEVDGSEGYVNLIYRVVDMARGSSLIFKQVMPCMISLLKTTGDVRPLDMNRIDSEIRSMVFMSTVYKDITPKIHLLDMENGIICMEDLSHLSLMRFGLAEMQTYPDFGLRMGAFLAEMLFFSSDLFLEPGIKQRWEQLFNSQESKKLLLHMFFDNCVLFDLDRPFEAEARETHKRIAAKGKLKKIVHDLGQRFYNEKQCICHSDLHVGNIMIDQNEVRIIDTEFGGYASPFIDLGRISSSFIINYISWLGLPEIPYGKRLAMQSYNHEMIQDLFNGYQEMLKRLFSKYSAARPGLRAIDPVEYFQPVFYDSIICAVLMAAFRTTSDMARSYDIERIKDSRALGAVQKRALEIAEYTLENAGSFKCISDFCEVIHSYAGIDIPY